MRERLTDAHYELLQIDAHQKRVARIERNRLALANNPEVAAQMLDAVNQSMASLQAAKDALDAAKDAHWKLLNAQSLIMQSLRN